MFKPYDDLFRQMEREMERMSNDVLQRFNRAGGGGRLWQPRVDVCETQDAVQVTIELAGLSADSIGRQIEVTLSADDRTLIISGHRHEPKASSNRVRCHQLEIYYGDFARVVPLPGGVAIDRESMRADYRDGFLTIRLPTRPPAQSRTIEVAGEPNR